ncbi:raftlin [Thalassophryne amazonica]|uniref:raftlin n=1 Tax=Thalassophryne amazonica TaxID=390379 RepID=UPI0014722678|nr:raftlin [Thalassophryne amazonica]
MGCRLPKLQKTSERRSPGNIYSTLRRPQVETKVGVAYTYHFLDFLLGKEEVPVSSVLCLSSVRELPVQVRELYGQGFVLVAVHPFVHPCGPRHAHIQRQLHRAVLVREVPSSEKSQLRWANRRLETDVCVAGQQLAEPEVIQNYVKKIQDVAEQGVVFVGFLQQPGGAPCFLGHWDPEELSSLHSSPSPIHRNPFSANTSPTDPTELHHINVEPDDYVFEPHESDHEHAGDTTWDQKQVTPDCSRLKPTQTLKLEESIGLTQTKRSTNQSQDYHKSCAGAVKSLPNQMSTEVARDLLHSGSTLVTGSPETSHMEQSHQESTERRLNPELKFLNRGSSRGSSSGSWHSSPELNPNRETRSNSRCINGQSRMTTHNNNHIRMTSSEEHKNESSPSVQARMQLFALYNHTGELSTSLRFYSLRVPLCVQKEAGLITEVDAHWLDHMTQHFISGAHLIDGFFHLSGDNDNGVSSVDSVFIFQSSAEENTNTPYDAIVVEQWTVVDGVVVKTDYIPLLQSLAPYGWKLMCVLPTPVVKTNSDGSLSTKQILFLQRPILQRKRKDFKMLNLRGRNKTKRNSAGETHGERENRSPVMECEMERLRRNTKEEEGERRKCSPQNDGEDAHQTDSASENQEETEIDGTPPPEQKTARWTDVCQRRDVGVKEEEKAKGWIKQQLSGRALFSGVC